MFVRGVPLVPLEKLKQWSPFDHAVWVNLQEPPAKITIEEVATAIAEGRLGSQHLGGCGLRRDHIERVAYLVVNPDPTPLDLDVGVPFLGCHVDWPIQDGHHRLAAAIFRNDALIDIDISGSIDYAEELFGVPFPRTVRERVLEAVRRHPRKTSSGLYMELEGLSRASISARLSELWKRGEVKASGNPRCYELSLSNTQNMSVAIAPTNTDQK